MSLEDRLKRGCLPKRVDPRTIRYRAIAPTPWPSRPAAYSWDSDNPGAVPTPMYANDRYGDCVLAERAHQTLRFEFDETGAAPKITDAEVVGEYLSETGGQDNGLVILDSLNAWRGGWLAGGGHGYTIHSFVEVLPQDHAQVEEACIVGQGLCIGIRLPLSAFDDMDAGQPWTLHAGPRGAAGSAGGHCVLVIGYDATGPEIVTWGTRQRVTWAFWDAFVDECFLVIDDVDRFEGAPKLALQDALAEATR